MALFDFLRRKKKDEPVSPPTRTAEAPEAPVQDSAPSAEAPAAVEEPVAPPAPAPPVPSPEAEAAAAATQAARQEEEQRTAAQAEEARRTLEERRRAEEEATARAAEAERRRQEEETAARERAAAEARAVEQRVVEAEAEQRATEAEAAAARAAEAENTGQDSQRREEADRQAALLDAEDSPELAAERARVEQLLSSVGPELRQRRIIDLLGVTFGRLAPAGDWGSTSITFRPARGKILLQVGTDGPEGGREGSADWKPVASFVEILIQELQRSMYEPQEGTWVDGKIVFTFRGEREDHRGRPVPPEPEVRVNFTEPPKFGTEAAPYSPAEAADFLTRFPRSPQHVPQWLADLARRGGYRG